MKTQRIVLEITADELASSFPLDRWDWDDLLGLDMNHEALSIVSCKDVETNQEHVARITEP